MSFDYKFENLFGCVYRIGNIQFFPDGNKLLSPVGNKITAYDLKNNKTNTFPLETSYNITRLAIAPSGTVFVMVDQYGVVYLCSWSGRCVLRTHRLNCIVHDISFSPNGKYFAVTKGNYVHVFKSPVAEKKFNGFQLFRILHGASSETTCLQWSADSRVLAVGSKDGVIRLFALVKLHQLSVYTLTGHTDNILSIFFNRDSLTLYSVCSNGQLYVWRSLIEQNELTELEEYEDQPKQSAKLYAPPERYYFSVSRSEGSPNAKVTASAFCPLLGLLVTGYSDGCFCLHEMPDFSLIHSFMICDSSISSLAFDKTGEWISVSSSETGILFVWEWKSESYIMKQQSSYNSCRAIDYSPDAQLIAVGSEDSKVKLWNLQTGFCVVTFSEHSGVVTGVQFSLSGKIVVSASLDGTVRAFDLKRYRNFRTFASPKPVQFSCLALDDNSDLVAAGGQNVFEIYIWSIRNGRLLEILSGHEGPVTSLCFSTLQTLLISCSWDTTVKFWDFSNQSSARETFETKSDILAMVISPNATELAVATLNCRITILKIDDARIVTSFDCLGHLGYTRRDVDKITAKTAGKSKAFCALSYSPDGKRLLAAGRSNRVCIFSVEHGILLKIFFISTNRSLDSIDEFLDKRKMSEWGSLSLVESVDDDKTKIILPGTQFSNFSSRFWKPEVRVFDLAFSPTGRNWAAASTEGVLVYSLDRVSDFDPFELSVDVTPSTVERASNDMKHSYALMAAFRLNDHSLITSVIEKIPISAISLVSSSLAEPYVDKLLLFLSVRIVQSNDIHLYMLWLDSLLMSHGINLKFRSPQIVSTITSIQQVIANRFAPIKTLFGHVINSIEYLTSLSELSE